MKKGYKICLGIILVILFSLLTYNFFGYLDYKSKLNNLEEYQLLKNEEIMLSFKDSGDEFLLSNYSNNQTSAGHNILLKVNNKYYLLANLQYCNFNEDNIYINANQIYIHCIGTEGNVIQYTIDNLQIQKKIWEFNYQQTPNISQLHMSVDKADKNYIYLSSPFKVDNNVLDEPKVKCSLKNNLCQYY